jgi:hypothetical protein
VLRGFLEVGKRQVTICIGNIRHLVEAGKCVADVRGIGERSLALLGKGEDALRQVVLLSSR